MRKHIFNAKTPRRKVRYFISLRLCGLALSFFRSGLTVLLFKILHNQEYVILRRFLFILTFNVLIIVVVGGQQSLTGTAIAAVGYTTPSCGLGFRQVNPDDPDGTRRNLAGCGDEESCASVGLNLFYCEPGTTYEIELFHTGASCNRDPIDVVNYTVGCPTP